MYISIIIIIYIFVYCVFQKTCIKASSKQFLVT